MIANEIMHNVLNVIDQQFLKVNEVGKDLIGIKDQCFEPLFLQGFWKKILFLIDVDSALELALTMRDFVSFKMLYLVYKKGVTDGKEIAKYLMPMGAQKKDFYKDIHLDKCIEARILGKEAELYEERNYFLKCMVNAREKTFIEQET